MNWWNGSVLRVVGYMPSCGSYDCTLFQSKGQYQAFQRIIADYRGKEQTPDFLSIGYDKDFDQKAAALAGGYVIVTGKVSTQCRSWSGKPQCLDRAADIAPISIEPLAAIATEARS
jgi:hypothetical protein